MSTLSGGPNIVTNGLVLYLDAANRYSYVSGSTAWNDLSRSGNNGTLINGPTFNTGSGGSIVFDGVNDYAEIPDNLSLNFGTGDFTVICWVSGISSTPASTKGIIWKGSRFDGNIAGWSMAWDGVGNLYFIISASGSRLERAALPVGTFTGGWNGYRMIGMQRSGGSWRQIDRGVVTTLGTFTGNVDNNFPIYVARNGAYNTYLNNIIGIVNIYNRALTSQEILQNYNTTKTRFGL